MTYIVVPVSVRPVEDKKPKLDYSMSVYSASFDGLSLEDKLNYRKI